MTTSRDRSAPESREVTPPRTLTLVFCPVCGRDDRFQVFEGRWHFSGGFRCPGTPVRVEYFRDALSTEDAKRPTPEVEGTAGREETGGG